MQCLFEREWHAGVVDILRCQAKVNKLLVGIQASNLIESLLDEIFHGLDIVIGDLLDVLDPLCAFLIEVAIDIPQAFEKVVIEVLQLRQRQLTQSDEILHLHTYAVADECIFREVVGQRLCLASIATIDRRDGRQCIQIHNAINKL